MLEPTRQPLCCPQPKHGLTLSHKMSKGRKNCQSSLHRLRIEPVTLCIQNLYCAAIKAGLYRKAVQVCYKPNTNTYSGIQLWVLTAFCRWFISNEPPHDKTNKMAVRPAKTQISLGIRPVWSESSLCAQWVAKDPSFLHADSEDSNQTGRMPRLIWVFAGRTCHFVGFVTRRLKSEIWISSYDEIV